MSKTYKAAIALEEFRNRRIVDIPHAKKRVVNQHETLYIFKDGSCLSINTTSKLISANNPKWKGRGFDHDNAPIKNVPCKIETCR